MEETGDLEETGGSLLVNNLLLILLTASVLTGFGLGQLTRKSEGQWTRRQIMIVGFPGELFLRIANLLVLPLIVSSLIASVSTSQPASVARLGRTCLIYFFVTKILAAGSAIIFATVLAPGRHGFILPGGPHSLFRRADVNVDVVLEILRNALPVNIVESCVFSVTSNPNDSSSNISEIDGLGSLPRVASTNYLGIIIFCIVVGLLLSCMPPEQRVMTNVFVCLSEAMKTLTHFSLWYFPIGICFMITSQTLISNEFFNQLSGSPGGTGLRMYLFTMLLCLGFHAMVTLPMLLFVFSKRRYTGLYSNLGFIIITAFGTSSSHATVPISTFTLERKMGMSSRMVGLVVPLGCCINFDGMIIYTIVTLVYYAQQADVVFTTVDYLYVSLFAILRSLRQSGTAGGLMESISLEMALLGIPIRSTKHVVITEWIIDRCLTVVNVVSDVAVCSILDEIDKTEKEEAAL